MDTTIAVTQFIVDEFAPDISASDLEPEYDLLESGIVDSLGLLTVIAWAEEEFGLTIDAGAIDEDDFRSVAAIRALIETSERTPRGTTA